MPHLNFVIIDLIAKAVHNFTANDLHDVTLAVGLDRREVDHRILSPFLHIVCYEYGLIKPKTDKYFTISKQLFNGPCVLYAAGLHGETISVPMEFCENLKNHESFAHFAWLDGIDAVEAAIAEGKVIRPQTTVNDEVLWEWNRGIDYDPHQIAQKIIKNL